MALMIIKESVPQEKQVIAQERFVVTLDGTRLVGPGDSGQLLAAAGTPIAASVAARLGIGPDGLRIVAKEAAPAETKELAPEASKRRRKK